MSQGFSPAELRSRILRRFEGSQPRHELADWRMLGVDAERSRRLQRHFPEDPVAAAVLVALVDRPEGLSVLLTERASQLAKHAAQISFPGGRLEDTDADIASAALREAQEEIGLDPSRVRVFGYLPDHLVFSGYRVTPVLSLVTPPIALMPNPAEVAGPRHSSAAVQMLARTRRTRATRATRARSTPRRRRRHVR